MNIEEIVEKAAAAIAEKYAPMHDARAPYAIFAAKEAARAALEAVVPMIRNAALEEAAKVADNSFYFIGNAAETAANIAAAIRALATPAVAEREGE